MKNLLLASSALVASASFAAADVSVGGNGYMGVTYDDSLTEETAFKSRLRITFSASGETDNGLSFGGSIRADNAGAGASGTAGEVYVSGGAWKLSMGDLDGALEMAVGDVAGVGYEGVRDLNEFHYYSGETDETLGLEVSMGSATVYATVGQFGANDTTASWQGGPDYTVFDVENAYAVGVSFDAGNFTIGAGYEAIDYSGSATLDQMGVSASTDLGMATVKAAYIKGDDNGTDFDQAGVSVVAPVAGVDLTAFYVTSSYGAAPSWNAYGVGVAYDLGGGATVKAGIVDNDGNTLADAGVTFSF